MKCLYMVIISLDPTGRGHQRWSNRWKAALKVASQVRCKRADGFLRLIGF
jgi:sigma54-dependent transcription regulator